MRHLRYSYLWQPYFYHKAYNGILIATDVVYTFILLSLIGAIVNNINPIALLGSKFTKVNITQKEKHFDLIKVSFDEDQHVELCVIQAVFTQNEYTIDLRELKDSQQWKVGWK